MGKAAKKQGWHIEVLVSGTEPPEADRADRWKKTGAFQPQSRAGKKAGPICTYWSRYAETYESASFPIERVLRVTLSREDLPADRAALAVDGYGQDETGADYAERDPEGPK